MKIDPKSLNYEDYKASMKELVRGETPKLAPKQVDDAKEVQSARLRENHRIQFAYNKELKKNVAHVVDNKTGEVVKKALSDGEVDRRIRIKKGVKRVLGDNLDTKI